MFPDFSGPGYPHGEPRPPTERRGMATKLYRVRSMKDDGTQIIWIALGRKHPPVPYAAAIKGLSADVEAADRARDTVDELFTYQEAEKWLAYLRRHHDDLRTEIVEEGLPLEATAKALSYPTGEERLLRVVKKEGYPFSDFEVHGYEVSVE
jgi:hypothetical protein